MNLSLRFNSRNAMICLLIILSFSSVESIISEGLEWKNIVPEALSFLIIFLFFQNAKQEAYVFKFIDSFGGANRERQA